MYTVYRVCHVTHVQCMHKEQYNAIETRLSVCLTTCLSHLCIYIINLPDAVTLGTAYNRGGACPVGQQGHVAVGSRLSALKAEVEA